MDRFNAVDDKGELLNKWRDIEYKEPPLDSSRPMHVDPYTDWFPENQSVAIHRKSEEEVREHMAPYAAYPRPSLSYVAMNVARAWAERATCPRKKVGCVILSTEGFTLATGYNGSPSGAKHCTEIGCEEDAYGHCARSIHAELNAITQAARRGTPLNNSVAYITLMPCLTCVKAMIQVGVKEIWWGEEYLVNAKEIEILAKLLEECHIGGGLYK